MVNGHVPAQLVRKGEHPLARAHGRQHALHQVLGLVRHAPADAARAEGALLAAEGHQAALRAVVTAGAGEAVPQHAAAQVAAQRLDHEGRRAGGARGEIRLEALVQELVQGPGGRVARLVLRRRRGWCDGGRRGASKRRHGQRGCKTCSPVARSMNAALSGSGNGGPPAIRRRPPRRATRPALERVGTTRSRNKPRGRIASARY